MKTKFLTLLLLLGLLTLTSCREPVKNIAGNGNNEGFKGETLIFRTVESMTDYLPSGNAAVILEGYYDTNDGGGGTFYWDAESTEEADNGLIFSSKRSDTGRYIRLHEENYVDILWFGVKADDGFDCSPAFRSAIDSLPSGGGTIHIPAGTYGLYSPVVVERKPVKFKGTGGTFGHMNIDETKIVCKASMESMITINGPVSDCVISGINLVPESNAGYALSLNGVSNSLFERIRVSTGNKGGIVLNSAEGENGASRGNLFLQVNAFCVSDGKTVLTVDGNVSAGNPVGDTTFETCRFDTAQTADSTGVMIRYAEKLTFKRCHFNTYNSASTGLILDPTDNPGYPKQNSFYDCSATSLHVVNDEIGYNMLIGHGTWDNESIGESAKLFGITDIGSFIK